jgi:hypothetical protein
MEERTLCVLCMPEPLMLRVLRFLSLEFSITSVESIRVASPNPTLSARFHRACNQQHRIKT